MILHLFPAEKFTTDYINRTNRLFGQGEHVFIVYGDNKAEYRLNEIDKKARVILTKTISSMGKKFETEANKCSKIILHSLFLKMVDLFFLDNYLKSHKLGIAWNIWGKDLYEDYEKSKTIKAILLVKPFLKEKIRKSLVKKIDIFITTGDYEILKKCYELKSSAVALGAQYTYNLLKCIETNKNDKVRIMVGHSATATCRHKETFEMLSKYSGKIEVFCPLSYPNNQEYIKSVTDLGKRYFNDDFYPMTDFMRYEEYVEFLNTVDIGIFNNSRQQGMGNITNLLYLGKKVYLSSDNTIGKSYHLPEYYIFETNDIQKEGFLYPLKEEERENNRENIKYKFSDENFYNEWRTVFDA